MYLILLYLIKKKNYKGFCSLFITRMKEESCCKVQFETKAKSIITPKNTKSDKVNLNLQH